MVRLVDGVSGVERLSRILDVLRARNRSSLKMATALMRRTVM